MFPRIFWATRRQNCIHADAVQTALATCYRATSAYIQVSSHSVAAKFSQLDSLASFFQDLNWAWAKNLYWPVLSTRGVSRTRCLNVSGWVNQSGRIRRRQLSPTRLFARIEVRFFRALSFGNGPRTAFLLTFPGDYVWSPDHKYRAGPHSDRLRDRDIHCGLLKSGPHVFASL